tara:strand:- start:3227 stop:3352 length:126 start_codon:yes stop_codon:yes gene_type:complete
VITGNFARARIASSELKNQKIFRLGDKKEKWCVGKAEKPYK